MIYWSIEYYSPDLSESYQLVYFVHSSQCYHLQKKNSVYIEQPAWIQKISKSSFELFKIRIRVIILNPKIQFRNNPATNPDITDTENQIINKSGKIWAVDFKPQDSIQEWCSPRPSYYRYRKWVTVPSGY